MTGPFKFSSRSQDNLSSTHRDLNALFREVIKGYDCTIIQGHRSFGEQNECYRTGRSKVEWPNSMHNKMPSLAVDVAPYPIDWNNRERFVAFAHYVRGVAWGLGYSIRWGGDWDMDNDLRDQTFMDLVHFEYLGKTP